VFFLGQTPVACLFNDSSNATPTFHTFLQIYHWWILMCDIWAAKSMEDLDPAENAAQTMLWMLDRLEVLLGRWVPETSGNQVVINAWAWKASNSPTWGKRTFAFQSFKRLARLPKLTKVDSAITVRIEHLSIFKDFRHTSVLSLGLLQLLEHNAAYGDIQWNCVSSWDVI